MVLMSNYICNEIANLYILSYVIIIFFVIFKVTEKVKFLVISHLYLFPGSQHFDTGYVKVIIYDT